MSRQRLEKSIKKEKKDYESRVLDIARVTRVVAGGRRFRFRTVVVAGNKKAKVGVGVAKGSDVAQSVDKATQQAKKNFQTIKITKGTISHRVQAKYGAAKIMLRPAKPGRGIVAGGATRVICELAGINDIVAKTISKSTNKLNNARATIAALQKLKA